MATPHKHAALIKAWADGAEIQYFDREWLDTYAPQWAEHIKYRLKPVVDPYQEFKDALKAGEVVQYAVGREWRDLEFADKDRIEWVMYNPSDFRIKPHKWQHIIDAHRSGKDVQYFYEKDGKWHTVKAIVPMADNFFKEHLEWRIQPTHKYQAVIDAHKAGAKVQYRIPPIVEWFVASSPTFSEDLEWRIAPKVIVKKYRIQYQPKDNWSGFLDGPVENLELTFEDDGSRVAKLVNAQVLE